MRLAASSFLLAALVPLADAFGIEDMFQQAFGDGGGGGGGQQFQFQMGGDGGMFDMGGGGRQQREPEWPRGIPSKISKKFSWLKGTEWNWNNWRNVKFEKDGTFEAPTEDCQGGQCLWSAEKNKIYILWGEAGVHELDVSGELPTEQNPQKLAGMRITGKRHSDGDRCHATFQRVFDHEAAALDKDLYEVLGIQDDAEEGDIKQVYRKLSKQYHPDKNPDEDSRRIFNEVRDAYEILNDPEKKILYDTGGMEAVKNNEKGQVEKGDDIDTRLDVSLDDLYNTGTHKAQIERRVVCRGCRVKPDSPKCRGCTRCPNEIKLVNRQVGPGMVIQQQEEVASKEKCKHENTIIDVQIEKGMRDGETVTFPRMGEQRPGIIPGGVNFQLKTTKHRMFTRRSDDLHMTMTVSLREALLGWTQKIRHLDGHIVDLGTESVTGPFQVMRVAGEGMPLRDDPASFGDLYIKIEVIIPPTLTSEQAEAVAKVFSEDAPRQEL